MMVYICTKIHENIMNGIRGMERARKITDGQKDGWTDGGHDIIRPVFDGRIKMLKRVVERRHPCLTPTVVLIHSPVLQFI